VEISTTRAIGDPVGAEVGWKVGAEVGLSVGKEVGLALGASVGEVLGIEVGPPVGAAVQDPHLRSSVRAHAPPSGHPQRFVEWVPYLLQSASFTRHSMSWPLWPLHLPTAQSVWSAQAWRTQAESSTGGEGR